MGWHSLAQDMLPRFSERLNKAFRGFVVLWGSTVYIESKARSRLWGGSKDLDVDLSRTTNNMRIQRYSKFALGAEMDICEFILTFCSIVEADLLLRKREKRPWGSMRNLTAQPDVSDAVQRGAQLALSERQNYYCYRLYTDCNHQDQSWRDSRWVVPGYFPHPGWSFRKGMYGIILRLKPNIALQQVENEKEGDQSKVEVFGPD